MKQRMVALHSVDVCHEHVRMIEHTYVKKQIVVAVVKEV